MTYLSRPTLYISASLLLLPGTAQSAETPGWSCQPTADGGWACAARPVEANTQPAPEAQPAAPATPVSADAPPAPAETQNEPAPIAATQTTPRSASLSSNTWDWVRSDESGQAFCAARSDEKSESTAAHSDENCHPLNGACDGAYVEPPRDWADADKSPQDLPVHIEAGNAEWEGDIVKMDGGVTVTQGNTRLTADSADLHRLTNQVNLHGNVVMHQPDMKISGNAADMTTTNSFGHVIDAQMLDYKNGVRVTADKLTRRKENVIELDKATYTYCPPDEEDWRLDSRRIRLNRETGRGEASHTVIRVADVPVLYTPYVNFPIDDRRQTGFLWPLMGKSSSGFDLAVPYYLNLAPNYDATLTPRLITDHGTMLETEARYINQYSNWIMSGNQLSNDKSTDEDRWLFGLRESGSINSYISTMIDYNRVSDNDYFRDFSINSINVKRQTALNEQAAVNVNYLNWYSSLQVQQYQTIDDLVAEPYRKMPQFIFGRNADGENFKLDYSLATEVTRFDHKDPDSTTEIGSPWITGDRLYLEPGISFPMRWTASFLNPELRMRYVGYNLTRPDPLPGETHPQTSVPQAILDSGLFFERDTELLGSSYQQTLEPRLYYLYSPHQKQTDQPLFDTNPLTFDYNQLFQPRRLVGHDRLEDFNQVATGVTSRIIEDESGAELGHASIGQIFYFADRRITASTLEAADEDTKSAVAGQLVLQPTSSLWATSNILWDQSNNLIEQGNASVHYENTKGAIFNIAYRYHEADPTVSTLTNGLRQADASVALPLNRRWRLLARFNYDIDLDSALEDLFGLEYEDCCWVMRIAYQRAALAETVDLAGEPILERDDTLLLEFQLKGLGNLGQKMTTLLEESIWGYRDRY